MLYSFFPEWSKSRLMSHLTRLHLKLLIWADLRLVREEGRKKRIMAKGKNGDRTIILLFKGCGALFRVRSFSTILQLKIFNEMERWLCFNWFYRFTWPCVLYPPDATVVEEHALGSPLDLSPSGDLFFFRTRPGFHKILDPFFPYWTKQVWQSTLFYKQRVTSFFQID